MARIVARTENSINSLKLLPKNVRHEKSLVDIGVLRFPDIDDPYFKV